MIGLNHKCNNHNNSNILKERPNLQMWDKLDLPIIGQHNSRIEIPTLVIWSMIVLMIMNWMMIPRFNYLINWILRKEPRSLSMIYHPCPNHNNNHINRNPTNNHPHHNKQHNKIMLIQHNHLNPINSVLVRIELLRVMYYRHWNKCNNWRNNRRKAIPIDPTISINQRILIHPNPHLINQSINQ